MSGKEAKRNSFKNFDMNRNLDVVFEDPREDRTTTQLETSGASLISKKQGLGDSIANKEMNASKASNDVKKPLLGKARTEGELAVIK